MFCVLCQFFFALFVCVFAYAFLDSHVCFPLFFVSFAKYDNKLQVGAPVGCTHKSLVGVVVAINKSKITIKNSRTNKNNKVDRGNVVVAPIAKNLIQHKRTKVWYKVLKPGSKGVIASKIEVPVAEPAASVTEKTASLPEQSAPANPSAQTSADRSNKKSTGALSSRFPHIVAFAFPKTNLPFQKQIHNQRCSHR